MAFYTAYYAQFQLLGVVALAMGLGALIGLEREMKRRPAGLRTHMLVAGAALCWLVWAMLLSSVLIHR